MPVTYSLVKPVANPSTKPRKKRTTVHPTAREIVLEAKGLDLNRVALLAHQSDDLCLTRPLPAGKSVNLCLYCGAEMELDQNQCAECDNFVSSL
ncbi:MAG: hypothetical protein HYV90_05220 [Candidatus Woesebacteria bacterium]|nr:MAG: hypothetical protein HYV90_05220 [Candidatus Woesebacteria bacterium]